MPAEDTTIRPFQAGFPEADLIELRRRVTATRWPEREAVGDDSQGAAGDDARPCGLLGERV